MMLQFLITPYVDGQALPSFRLYIDAAAPAAPADGDVWLDTSGADTSLGNATAGTLVAAQADYLVKIRNNAGWKYHGTGGQKGQRATIPLPFTHRRGTRMSLSIVCEEADRRYQLEGWGWKPMPVTSAQ
jgi:hypothetical protein